MGSKGGLLRTIKIINEMETGEKAIKIFSLIGSG